MSNRKWRGKVHFFSALSIYGRGDEMDIAQASMNLASSETIRGFGFGMMRKSMDQMEQVGELFAQMMQEMAQVTGQGVNIDIRV